MKRQQSHAVFALVLQWMLEVRRATVGEVSAITGLGHQTVADVMGHLVGIGMVTVIDEQPTGQNRRLVRVYGTVMHRGCMADVFGAYLHRPTLPASVFHLASRMETTE